MVEDAKEFDWRRLASRLLTTYFLDEELLEDNDDKDDEDNDDKELFDCCF